MMVDAITDQALTMADELTAQSTLMSEATEKQCVMKKNEMKPKRIVLLAAFITLVGGCIYGLNIFCNFLLKLAQNGEFVQHIVDALTRCEQLSQCIKPFNSTLGEEEI